MPRLRYKGRAPDILKKRKGDRAPYSRDDPVQFYSVVIAGSGPVGCAYARTILEQDPDATVLMVEIGSQDNPVIGAHQKNSIKYQKDIDKFVNVIQGALQTISLPPAETYIPTLVGDGWTPPVNPNGPSSLVFQGSNPNQVPEFNLRASAVTRTVGGMATHWTCACPIPHDEELSQNPIPKAERDALFERARKLLNVHNDQYDMSMRHTTVKKALLDNLPAERQVQSLPLAVKRRTDNPAYVTWSGANTVLGDVAAYGERFTLLSETRFTKLHLDPLEGQTVLGAELRDLRNDADLLVVADAYVITAGAVATPQILFNSGIRPEPLGRYLCEQSLAFCQIVMKNELVDSINDSTDPAWQERIARHREKHPGDPLPIPFPEPEPNVMIPYTTNFPYHCQIHRDAFSYGDVGPRADPRVVVDLRFFGKQEIKRENRVYFGPPVSPKDQWVAGNTDTYGMPQATFEVTRTQRDSTNDQRIMRDLCATADILGAYLPASNPQFMEPGLALHITGTTRIGKDPESSVADPSSRVHGFYNLWVGGNGCIPDSTASNPTLTSVTIALKGAESIVERLRTIKEQKK